MEPLIRFVDLPLHGDERGDLVVLEEGAAVGFDIRRVFFLPRTQAGVVRGFHAHHALQQILIAVAGSCTIRLDDGRRRVDAVLDRPDRGLHIGPMIWHEMHEFSPDCVLLSVASDTYDEADYVRDYDAFVALLEHR